MRKVRNSIDNNYDEHFIIVKAAIEANKQDMKAKKQDYDEKMTKFTG